MGVIEKSFGFGAMSVPYFDLQIQYRLLSKLLDSWVFGLLISK